MHKSNQPNGDDATRFQGIDLNLKTARLLLRPVAMHDAEDVFRVYASDPAVTKFLVFLPHTSIVETREFIASRIANTREGKSVTWIINLEAERVGAIELRVEGTTGDVGFAIGTRWWGRGIVAEALQAVVAFAQMHLALSMIGGKCDGENTQSARVFEKCGFRNLGTQATSIHPAFGSQPRAAISFELNLNAKA